MTPNEKKLVDALESDITTWEQEIQFFDKLVNKVESMDGYSVPGKEYANGLRKRVQEWRDLIRKVREG